MKILKIVGFILLIAFGIFMIVYGEHDDSPGGQGLGLIAAITGAVYLFKTFKRQ